MITFFRLFFHPSIQLQVISLFLSPYSSFLIMFTLTQISFKWMFYYTPHILFTKAAIDMSRFCHFDMVEVEHYACILAPLLCLRRRTLWPHFTNPNPVPLNYLYKLNTFFPKSETVLFILLKRWAQKAITHHFTRNAILIQQAWATAYYAY